IAVLVPNLINPFFAKLSYYLNIALAASGYQMLLYSTDYNPQLEQAYIIMAEQKKVDGIICLSYNPNLEISDGVSFVSIDRHFGSYPCVSSDNYGGGRLAAQKLYENGCKNLAFVRIGSKLTSEPNKRKDGFVSECELLGIPYTLKIVDDEAPYSEFDDFLHENYHDGRLAFDGIFCVTDTLAYQIICYLQKMGLRVPEDVQVIGFDGTQHLGNLDLVCSTIVQPVEELAKACVNLVLSQDASYASSLICLPTTYAYGGTTLA
ncbi:MAG: substrate-binding domain-containing protein, partial [Acetatifactor sp.]|nr:substrate-binding domain-containing protein [Acetatifactor sp.]